MCLPLVSLGRPLRYDRRPALGDAALPFFLCLFFLSLVSRLRLWISSGLSATTADPPWEVRAQHDPSPRDYF